MQTVCSFARFALASHLRLDLLLAYVDHMHPKTTTTCDVCGGPAEATVIPDGFNASPATYTMQTICQAGHRTHTTLSAQGARVRTKHAYDGVSVRWTRLTS